MARKTKPIEEDSLDIFVAEVNRCGRGHYDVGLSENTETTSTLRTTVFFHRAGWRYVTGSGFNERVLVLFGDGEEQERIRIYKPQSAELLRQNTSGSAYVIIAGASCRERHLLCLENG